MMRLKEKYNKEIIPAMKEKFGRKNSLSLPKLVKVVLNTGINPNKKNEEVQQSIAKDLAAITGQKAMPCKAKKAEAGFNIREGMIIGMAVTLRKDRMYDFIEMLLNVALPRSRDFHGLSEKNVDQNGNLNIGIKEQIIFPEISTENVKYIFGFQVTIVTTAKNRKEGLEFFKLLGVPFEKK